MFISVLDCCLQPNSVDGIDFLLLFCFFPNTAPQLLWISVRTHCQHDIGFHSESFFSSRKLIFFFIVFSVLNLGWLFVGRENKLWTNTDISPITNSYKRKSIVRNYDTQLLNYTQQVWSNTGIILLMFVIIWQTYLTLCFSSGFSWSNTGLLSCQMLHKDQQQNSYWAGNVT